MRYPLFEIRASSAQAVVFNRLFSTAEVYLHGVSGVTLKGITERISRLSSAGQFSEEILLPFSSSVFPRPRFTFEYKHCAVLRRDVRDQSFRYPKTYSFRRTLHQTRASSMNQLSFAAENLRREGVMQGSIRGATRRRNEHQFYKISPVCLYDESASMSGTKSVDSSFLSNIRRGTLNFNLPIWSPMSSMANAP